MSCCSTFQFFVVCAGCALMALSPVYAHAQSAFNDPGARTGATGGDITPVNSNLTGNVSLGSSSQIVVLFRNDDTKPLNISETNLYPSSNVTAQVSENQCSSDPVQPGEICAITIEIKGLQQGNYRIEMLMRHDGRSKLLTTTIGGTVESSGDASQDLISDIEAIPSKLDFGALNESRSQVKAVVFRNITSKPVKIEAVEIEAGLQSGFSINQNCGILETGQACVASVTWSPEQSGPSSGIIVVRHNGPTGVATVELTGQYSPTVAAPANVFPQAVPGKGLLVSSDEEVNFGSAVGQASSITVSLVNVGDVPLTLNNIQTTNVESGIKVEKMGCQPGSVLAPIEACPLTLTWEPVREGAILDDIKITHSGARGILVMPVRGTATQAINKDDKPILLKQSEELGQFLDRVEPLNPIELQDDSSMDDVPPPSAKPSNREQKAKRILSSQMRSDVDGALDGFSITSYAATRAVVRGPGGSRVVFDGEQAVIGGVLWEIMIRPSAVEFRHEDQTVLLLFDRSLSSVNPDATQSEGEQAAPAASVSDAATETTTQ